MRVVKRVIGIGDSDGVILDKIIMETLNITRGDRVDIIIKKFEEKDGAN